MRINTNNVEKLQRELDKVQRLARTRTITTEDIKQAVKTAEENLVPILQKKNWSGIAVRINLHAQKFAASYRGMPESTQFTLTRGSNAWFLTDLVRSRCGTVHTDLCADPTQRSLIADFVVRSFGK